MKYLFAFAALLSSISTGQAQTAYPSRPIRVIVPFTPSALAAPSEVAKWAKVVKLSGAKAE